VKERLWQKNFLFSLPVMPGIRDAGTKNRQSPPRAVQSSSQKGVKGIKNRQSPPRAVQSSSQKGVKGIKS